MSTRSHGPEVLLVESRPADAGLVRQALRESDQPFGLTWVQTLAEAREGLARARFDCVLLDLGLPDTAQLEGLEALLRLPDAPPVVVLTEDCDEARGVDAVHRGAQGYLRRSQLSGRMLQQVLSCAIERSRSHCLLQQALARSEAVLSSLAEGVLVRDALGQAVSLNPAAERMLGLTLEQLQSDSAAADGWRVVRPDGGVIGGDELPGVVAARTGELVEGVLTGVHRADGTFVWLEINCHPLQTSGSARSTYGAVTSFRDVTARLAAEESNRFQAALLDAVGQAVVAIDAEGTVLYCNQRAQAMYGWSSEEVVGRDITDVTRSLSLQDTEQALKLMVALREGRSWTGQFLVRRRDGSTFPALVTNTPVLDGDGRLTATISVSTDMTDRQQSEEAMRRLSAIVASSGDAIIGKDLDGIILSWNRAAEQLYGFAADEVLGKPISMLAPADRLDELAAVMSDIRAGQTVTGIETRRQHRSGHLLDVALTVSPVSDAFGQVVAASAIARDIGDRLEMQRALEHQALHDALTGLPNRVLVTDRLGQALETSRRHEMPVAVIFLDLDNFKNINDATGHQTGDLVLVEVARRLQETVRPGDTVARFGGDEFVILCERTDEQAALRVANRVLEALTGPVELDDRSIYVSASIGIAVSPPVEGAELLRFADAAMYDAKARGRSRAVVFDEALAQTAEERWQLSNDLRRALENDGLELWYQPIVDLTTGAVLGVEALCRWNHPTLGMVPPDRIVAVAEGNGLSFAFDRWVLQRACLAARELLDNGLFVEGGHVAVNISARNVCELELEACVREAVEAAGIPFSAIVLEVTETGVMADPERASRLLQELRALGVTISLDDFGTGYSSLTYLRRLPVSTIKIDRSFISEMVNDPDDLAIVVSIIDLARSVNLDVVAEGIETAEQLALLRRLGCAAGQGWLWSAALPLDEVLANTAVGEETGHGWPRDLPAERPRRRRRELDVTAEHGLTRLVQLHREGASLTTIAAALNKDGFRTPKGQRWHSVSVARTIADMVRLAPARR
jgi:diguanylate cyclase (GGDEF)-like protein/PAS domain S-box-containing protein